MAGIPSCPNSQRGGVLRRIICVTVFALAASILLAPMAQAAENDALICDDPKVVYSFKQVSKSSRGTKTKSAYITGPGTISFNRTVSTSVGATVSASATAEASVILAKASTTLGLALTASRSWTDGFNYSLVVPSGKRRAMRLYQESRSFRVTKKQLRSPCEYVTQYSNQPVNAPRKKRVDEWKLVS
jgi:hypothetical protein